MSPRLLVVACAVRRRPAFPGVDGRCAAGPTGRPHSAVLTCIRSTARFQTIPHKLKSDLVGMRRPRSALGRIQVEFHLQLLQPLTDTYWTALPPLPPTFGGISRAVPRANSSDDLLPDFKAIKWNVERIESVLKRPPSWLVVLGLLRSWHVPLLSLGFTVFMSAVIMTVKFFQLPMLFVSIVCVLSFLSHKLRPTLRDREVVTFYEEDPEAPTVIEKALEAKKQLIDVQKYTGLAAETLERLRNALNWSDENVSLLFCAALSAAGALLSMALLVIELAASHINPRWVFTLVFVQLMLPPRAREFFHELFRHGPFGFLIRDVEAALGADLTIHPLAAEGSDDDDVAGFVTV